MSPGFNLIILKLFFFSISVNKSGDPPCFVFSNNSSNDPSCFFAISIVPFFLLHGSNAISIFIKKFVYSYHPFFEKPFLSINLNTPS